ncbi:hypothetical protein [Labrys sp. (in: a-proteobacteria)]
MSETSSETSNSKTAIDLACSSVRLRGKLTGHNETWSDLKIMTLAKEQKMRPGGRAQQYLDHYLQGSGTPMPFSVRTLLNEDPGVRGCIFREVNASIMTAEVRKQGSVGLTGSVAVKQFYFQNIDWQYATGALNVQWQCMGEEVRNGTRVLLVDVWCQNLYRWHPGAGRATDCVHRAAVNLQAPQPETRLVLQPVHVPGAPSYAQSWFRTETTNYQKAKDFLMVAPRERILVPRTSGKAMS